MPRKSKANRQLELARENAKSAKLAKTDVSHVPDLEFLERIQLPLAVAATYDSDIEDESDAAFVIDRVHWRLMIEEPIDSQLYEDEDKRDSPV